MVLCNYLHSFVAFSLIQYQNICILWMQFQVFTYINKDKNNKLYLKIRIMITIMSIFLILIFLIHKNMSRWLIFLFQILLDYIFHRLFVNAFILKVVWNAEGERKRKELIFWISCMKKAVKEFIKNSVLKKLLGRWESWRFFQRNFKL